MVRAMYIEYTCKFLPILCLTVLVFRSSNNYNHNLIIIIIYGLCFTTWKGIHSTRKDHDQQLTTQLQHWNTISLVYSLKRGKSDILRLCQLFVQGACIKLPDFTCNTHNFVHVEKPQNITSLEEKGGRTPKQTDQTIKVGL